LTKSARRVVYAKDKQTLGEHSTAGPVKSGHNGTGSLRVELLRTLIVDIPGMFGSADRNLLGPDGTKAKEYMWRPSGSTFRRFEALHRKNLMMIAMVFAEQDLCAAARRRGTTPARQQVGLNPCRTKILSPWWSLRSRP